jgi:peptide/nickel transport system substrate-binding protein
MIRRYLDMRFTKPLAYVAAALFLVASALTASAQRDPDTLVIGVGVDPVCMDPPFLAGLTADSLATQIYDRMGWRSEPDMSPVLWAAESVEQIEPLVWQVRLRDGIRFHNGAELTAESVKFSIERYALPGGNRWYYNQAGIDRVDVVDRLTANIITTEPFQLMLPVVANSWYLVEPDHYAATPLEQLCTRPIGTGPYRVVEYVRDDRVVLERFEDYWGELPDFRRVIYRVIPDAAVRLAELEVGNIDIMEKLPIDRAQAVERMDGVRAIGLASGRRVYFLADRRDGPLANTQVMQAIQHAVDVDTIIETLLGGFTERMATFPNVPVNPDLSPYSYDPERARQLLAEAGFPNGFSIPFYTPIGRLTSDVQVAQAVAAYLGEVGIRADVETLEWSVFSDRYRSGQLSGLFMVSEGPEYHDQGDLQGISVEHAGSMGNYGWDNPEWRELYRELRVEPDPDRRRELSFRLQELAWEDPPMLMLYNEPNLYGVSDRVEWAPRVDERLYASRVFQR